MHRVSCSVCGSGRQQFYLQEGKFTVVACVDCGHLYTSPLPDVEMFAKAYEASGGWIKPTDIAVQSGADSRFLQYAATLEQLIQPKATVLEIGCSKGRFLYLLQQRNFDCYGVEPSRDAEVASQLLGADKIWHTYYIRPLPIKPDVVAMFEVLEHIPQPHRTAETIFEQLRPGGYFMGSVPNGTFIRAKVWPRRVARLRWLVVPLIMDAGNHINYFSPQGIRSMLERIGFEFLWSKNSPLDFNYIANRLSPLVKRAWWILAQSSATLTRNLIASNIWFLARRPD